MANETELQEIARLNKKVEALQESSMAEIKKLRGYVAFANASLEPLQSELARLQERVAQLEAALREAIHLIDDPAHLISDITANARAALEGGE